MKFASFSTTSGRCAIANAWAQALSRFQAHNFSIDPNRSTPKAVERAGGQVVEAFLQFLTAVRRGAGLLRMRRDADASSPMAWTLQTTLEEIRGHEESTLRAQCKDPVYARDFHGSNWLERRPAAPSSTTVRPPCLSPAVANSD